MMHQVINNNEEHLSTCNIKNSRMGLSTFQQTLKDLSSLRGACSKVHRQNYVKKRKISSRLAEELLFLKALSDLSERVGAADWNISLFSWILSEENLSIKQLRVTKNNYPPFSYLIPIWIIKLSIWINQDSPINLEDKMVNPYIYPGL